MMHHRNAKMKSDNIAHIRVSHPKDLNPAFAAACNKQDLEGLLSLYEPTAKLVLRSGEVVNGHTGIERSLRRLISIGGVVEAETTFCLVHGDTALVNADWSITGGTTPEGQLFSIRCRSAEVICQQPDGSWKLRIDNPFALLCDA
jgi:ketosteroid isomerase-like protein